MAHRHSRHTAHQDGNQTGTWSPFLFYSSLDPAARPREGFPRSRVEEEAGKGGSMGEATYPETPVAIKSSCPQLQSQ